MVLHILALFIHTVCIVGIFVFTIVDFLYKSPNSEIYVNISRATLYFSASIS